MLMEAIILCGLQGAGKSTFCRERYWDSHVRINYDMLRTRHRESILLSACIAARQPLVVDATNPTAEDRARYIVPCKQAAFRIIGIEFRVSTEFAIARNARREGRARVPEKAIWATAGKFIPLSLAEGSDEIWLATAAPDGIQLMPLTEP
jgi:predicted kinase